MHDGIRRIRSLSDLCDDTRGVSAIEFALILPIMLMLLFGITEFGRAFDHYRKVTLLARTLADIASQGDTQTPMAAATLSDIFASAKLVLTPYPNNTAQIVISALGVAADGVGQLPRVCSSYATGNGTARAVGTAADLKVPEGFQLAGMRYVLAEVSVPYPALFGSNIMRLVGGANNQFTFKASVPWPTRGGQAVKSTYNEIVLPNGKACS
ncbi:pilus assembly protein [Methylobacterium mesophilicum SR1.6/6]|uniref:Pilus assembly protein n=1 Tax=Methylobacterium mesophilicum SR1.6/6 TaxID=908290 RepID=A0A6B9FZA3_9HYPH|nr:TadE/TadG family type IV pilus assembly protein [Methylobacterium mesophilicum]QGY05515.1 pilus assembly protein [Methylobacterium mesophilicum SR1.6/6]